MRQKRMFDKDVIQADWFTDMPSSTQMLYIHLSMNADDDGCVNNVKTAMMNAHATDNDLVVLIQKDYLKDEGHGLYVITDWFANNYIRSDRYKPSKFAKYLTAYAVSSEGRYIPKESIVEIGSTSVYQCDDSGIPNIEENRIEENRIEKNNRKKEYKGEITAQDTMRLLREKRKKAGYADNDDELF